MAVRPREWCRALRAFGPTRTCLGATRSGDTSQAPRGKAAPLLRSEAAEHSVPLGFRRVRSVSASQRNVHRKDNGADLGPKARPGKASERARGGKAERPARRPAPRTDGAERGCRHSVRPGVRQLVARSGRWRPRISSLPVALAPGERGWWAAQSPGSECVRCPASGHRRTVWRGSPPRPPASAAWGPAATSPRRTHACLGFQLGWLGSRT